MPNDSLELTLKRPPLSAFSLRLVYPIALLFNDPDQRRRAFFPFRSHPSFGSGVRWSRALIASAISMNLLLFGVASPISGWLIDRYGPRKVMLGSLGLLIIGVSGTMAMNQFWQFFWSGELLLDLAPAESARF